MGTGRITKKKKLSIVSKDVIRVSQRRKEKRL